MIQGFSGGLLNRELIYQTDLPSFQRDFASLKTLDHGTGPNITFTRNSVGTYFDQNGTLQTASNDVPRFDHNPSTGASLGLLIEESRENLFQRSAEISNAYWQKNNLTVTADTHTAPDGTLTADSVIENVTTAGAHRLDRGMTATSGVAYTLSAFVKLASGTRRPRLFAGATFGNWTAVFDLVNGTVGTTTGGPTTSITNVGNGWYRISGTKTATSTGLADTRIEFIDASTGNLTYDGDGTSGFYVWGMQLEAGAFPTSYIPTTTAAATRAADSAVVTPISSFYNQAEGTLFAEVREGGSDVQYGAASLDTDTSDNRIDIRRSNDANNIGFLVSTGAASQAQLSRSLVAASQTYKAIVAYATNDIAAVLNGGTPTTDTSATLPTLTHFRIGGLGAVAPSTGNSFHANGHIRKIAYWPKRLTNTLLEQLTT